MAAIGADVPDPNGTATSTTVTDITDIDGDLDPESSSQRSVMMMRPVVPRYLFDPQSNQNNNNNNTNTNKQFSEAKESQLMELKDLPSDLFLDPCCCRSSLVGHPTISTIDDSLPSSYSLCSWSDLVSHIQYLLHRDQLTRVSLATAVSSAASTISRILNHHTTVKQVDEIR